MQVVSVQEPGAAAVVGRGGGGAPHAPDLPTLGASGCEGRFFSLSFGAQPLCSFTHAPACPRRPAARSRHREPPLANVPRSARFTTTLVSHVSLRAAGGGTRRARPCMIPTNRTIRTHTSRATAGHGGMGQTNRITGHGFELEPGGRNCGTPPMTCTKCSVLARSCALRSSPPRGRWRRSPDSGDTSAAQAARELGIFFLLSLLLLLLRVWRGHRPRRWGTGRLGFRRDQLRRSWWPCGHGHAPARARPVGSSCFGSFTLLLLLGAWPTRSLRG